MGKAVPVRLLVMSVALLLLVAGCQSESPATLTAPDDPATASKIEPGPKANNGDWKQSGLAPAELDRHWQQWLDDPWGIPGVDYNDKEIAVGYRRGARVPAKYSAAAQSLDEHLRAKNRPNAILRHDTSYETVTDAIAAAYSLEIRHQVYNDYSIWASFTVADGRDSAAIIERIRTEFAESIEFATFPGAGEGAWLPDDPDFLDYTGTQVAPEQMWGQHLIDCETAWDYTRGEESIVIAVIDDAYLITHEEHLATVLDPEVAYPESQLDVGSGDNIVTPDNPQQGHGTKVISLIIAEGNNNRSIIGVAPDCRLMPIKIAHAGHQYNTDFTVGVHLAIDLGAKVINASWGSWTPYQPMAEAAERAYNNGVLFVAAVHNNDNDLPIYPAAYEYLLGVGATGFLPDGSTMDDWEADTRSDFSNYGAFTDMAAPGKWLKTCSVAGEDAYDNAFSGTSASCPLVAGAAALIYSLNPGLSVDRVADALTSTGAPTADFPIGTVLRLDIPAAIAEALRELEVSGTVIDGSTGQGLPGVTVGLTGLESQVSAGDGTFLISGVSDGNYTLTVELPGYTFALDGSELLVDTGDITDLEIVGWRADLPVLDSLSIAEYDIFGLVVNGTPVIDVSAVWQASAGNAGSVVYALDLVEIGVVDPYDLQVDALDPAPGFPAQIQFGSATPNQLAWLTATPFHTDGTPGQAVSLPVYIFNQPGDVNGDGVVNAEDRHLYNGKVGLTPADDDYLPFFDTNLDDIITELDVAAVGYHWSAPDF